MTRAFLLALTMLAASVSSIAAGFSFGTSAIRMSVQDYGGWAVCSMTFNGYEFIDGYDHGRCLQSASSFDGKGEAFNPTEAGSAPNGALPNPSSTLLFSYVDGPDRMASEVQMAFWQGGRSDHVLRKWLWVGWGGRDIIEHRIAFELPLTETHTSGQFEVLTGYMPPAFSKFLTWNPSTGVTASLSDGPGEQSLPLIFCTSDDTKCMGVFSPLALANGGYGRWRFGPTQCVTKAGATGCVKWNMVMRVTNPKGVYRFHVFSTVGTLAQVKANLALLKQTFPG